MKIKIAPINENTSIAEVISKKKNIHEYLIVSAKYNRLLINEKLMPDSYRGVIHHLSTNSAYYSEIISHIIYSHIIGSGPSINYNFGFVRTTFADIEVLDKINFDASLISRYNQLQLKICLKDSHDISYEKDIIEMKGIVDQVRLLCSLIF